MIVFFTTARHRYALKGILRSPHRTAQISVRSYDYLFRQSSIVAATCVFTDFDRLHPYELTQAADLYRQMRESGIRVLNDPAAACHREELLFRLHKAGINKFQAYRAVLDPRPTRFPVFLKSVSGHSQDIFELIGNQEHLDLRLGEYRARGIPLTHMLVIEFANRAQRENVYRRHTIYRIGERMVPANPVTEASPFVKYGHVGLATDAERERAIEEIMTNPHAELMRRVFEIAGIEYGRADFGFDGEDPAVFEINTNPTIGERVSGATGAYLDAVAHSMKGIAEAASALDGEDKKAKLRHSKHYFTRLDFSYSPRLKQP
jgi:hypothetical protein